MCLSLPYCTNPMETGLCRGSPVFPLAIRTLVASLAHSATLAALCPSDQGDPSTLCPVAIAPKEQADSMS